MPNQSTCSIPRTDEDRRKTRERTARWRANNTATIEQRAVAQRKTYALPPDLPGEEWRSVVGYEGWYEVSNMGRIKRVRWEHNTYAGRILTGKICSGGYFQIALCRGPGDTKQHRINRLVATAFHGQPPSAM